MKTNFYTSVLAIFAIGLLIRFVLAWPDDRLHYIQCDAGQGDAILISKQFDQILVDAGSDEKVLDCLQAHLPFWDKKIEMVVATHSDKDHIGGFSSVFDHYQVENLVWNGVESQETIWQDLQKKILAQNSKLLAIASIKQITIGGIKFDFIWPITKVIESSVLKDNELSVVTKIQYDQFSILLTGDIPTVIENILLSQEKDLKSEILKISHHGSKTASSIEFLTEVEPIIATIGVGKNSFGHPSLETLQKLNELKVKVFRTDQIGDIEVVTDGKEIEIRD